jgi:hypothetical protein
MRQLPEPKPPLSPQQSFVVQFRAETVAPPAAYDGRVEHVTSGQATLFSSPEELLAFITRVLADVRMEASHDR